MQLALILIITLSAIATFGLKWDETEVPETKNWRWALHKRRIQRWFIYKAWQAYIPNLRWLVLLFIALITYWLVRKYLPDFKISKIAKLSNASDATVMLALIGAPVAYVIWWFRDANARQQIENQRKDVNLKDFQRLAEWAAGMHLPENKVTTSEKEIKVKTSASIETVTSTETSAIPTSTVIRTPSRREGAASLQIAAIYQLQAFLQGEYGRYFQRPAFQLLKSIWLALVSQNHVELEELLQEDHDFANEKDKSNFKISLIQWKRYLQVTMNSPIGEAITVALGAQQGWLLRTHQADLPNAILTGYNSRLAAMKQPLELDGLNLTGIKLQGADLSGAELQGANLSGAQLQGANLTHAQLQGAILLKAQLQGAILINSQLQDAYLGAAQMQGVELFGAQMQGANLSDTNLQGADLSDAQLQGTYLFGAQLQGADLRHAQMHGAYLSNTVLQGTDLFGAQLQGADLSFAELQGAKLILAALQGAKLNNVYIDAKTNFMECDTDGKTEVVSYDGYNSVDIVASIKLRQQLKKVGLVLPDELYQQLYSEPTEYKFKNKEGEIETRHDVGLFSSF